MAQSQQTPEQPRHHGRMSPDEMEQAIRELRAQMIEMQTFMAEMKAAPAPQVVPTPTPVSAMTDGTGVDLKRTPSATDTRRPAIAPTGVNE